MEQNSHQYDENLDEILTSVYYENKKESFQVLHILIVGIVFVLLSVFFLVFPKSKVSESENRNLAQFPPFSFDALVSGKYTADITAYFNDTVPYRDTLMEISAFVSDLHGIRFDDVKIHNVVIGDTESASDSSTASTPSTQSPDVNENTSMTSVPDDDSSPDVSTPVVNDQIEAAPEQNNDENATIENNGILVAGTRGLMLYGGSFTVGTQYAQAINEYKKALGDDVNVYSMVIPTSVEFYCPSSYKYLTKSELDNINNIISSLDEVKAVNVYTTLSEHTDEPIYFRTDHHWAPLGAYYAAQEFAKNADVPFVDISQYEKVTKSGYVGTLYSYSNDIKLKQNPEDFVYYVSPNEYSATYYNYDKPLTGITGSPFVSYPDGSSMLYCTFFGGDSKVVKINTDVTNGRKLAIFKDSYGNAIAPFLFNSFEEIYVIDMRYFPHNAIDYLKEHGVTDVLFANNAFHAATASTVKYYNTLRTQADYSASLQYATTAATTTAAPEETSKATTTAKTTKPHTTKKTTDEATTAPPETTESPAPVTTAPEPPTEPATTPDMSEQSSRDTTPAEIPEEQREPVEPPEISE